MGVEKRQIEKLDGINLSLLGFGTLRYPTKNGKIDEELAEEMIDYAYRSGVNYFDTAWNYHEGKSEPFTARILKKYPRNTYFYATKLPCWKIGTIEDAKRIFDIQLEKVDGGYIDFYLLHALNRNKWSVMKDLGVIEYIESLKEEGKINYFGFSFHGDYDTFEEIINYRDWDFCQIQLNYMDTFTQAGMRGYRLTEEKNVPLVIMEPVKGGLLAEFPNDIEEILKRIDPNKSIASYALRWVASLPNVKVVLSGMSNKQHVCDNILTFSNFEPLSAKEYEAVEEVVEALAGRVNNGCTGCRYCMPCPVGVNIPNNFWVWNQMGMYKRVPEGALYHWNNVLTEDQKPNKCIKCGKCETLCPQKLTIRDDLEKMQLFMSRIQQ